MASNALVSVIMNCYNGEKYLAQAIDSVLRQTYQNWEIIFWDNQSTDGSANVFRRYRDPRLKYFHAPTHTWLYEARNYAIERSSGEFIAFLDVDDWWTPAKLEKQIALFANEEVGFVCGNYFVENETKNTRWLLHKRPAPTGWVLDALLTSQIIGLLTLVVRRSALDSLSYPCDPRYHIIGDLDLTIRLSLRWQLACIQEPVAHYRLHDGNESFRHRSRHIEELRTWIGEMSLVPPIRSSPGWSRFEQSFLYLQAMHALLEGHRAPAFGITRQLPIGRLWARLMLALALPLPVLRRIKN